MTWEQAVEKQALIAAYTRRTGRSITLQQLIAGVGADDPDAVDVAAAWARWVAYGLLAVAYSHDPDDIIIAGEMAPLFAACRGVVERHDPRDPD